MDPNYPTGDEVREGEPTQADKEHDQGVNFRYVLCLEQFISILQLVQYFFQISNKISIKVNCR